MAGTRKISRSNPPININMSYLYTSGTATGVTHEREMRRAEGGGRWSLTRKTVYAHQTRANKHGARNVHCDVAKDVVVVVAVIERRGKPEKDEGDEHEEQ